MSEMENVLMPNDVVVARYIPPMSMPDMGRLAEAIARSQLFGIKTVDQAIALMAIAQAEGRHPALAARDYDIIQGRPSKKAEAMLRDFLISGGVVEWHDLSDTVADATFAHQSGGTVRIKWDMERARQAGLAGKAGDMWKKYPRQMLRSRCVSEGVRTVCPMATSGMYVPEEVADFDEPPKRGKGKQVEIEHEAPEPAANVIDAETGEVIDPAQIEREARSAAATGTENFREYLKGLSKEARGTLRPLIGTRDEPGELTRLAQRTDEALREVDRDDGPVDAFGLPAAEHAIPDLLGGAPRPAPSYHVTLPDPANSDDWNAWELALMAMIDAGDSPAAIWRDNKDNIDIFEQVAVLRHNKLVRALGR